MTTVTLAVPVPAMSLAGMVAVNRVSDTKLVVRSSPFHRTSAPDTNSVPFTVNVNPGSPAVVLSGTMEVMVGTGLNPSTTSVFSCRSSMCAVVSMTFPSGASTLTSYSPPNPESVASPVPPVTACSSFVVQLSMRPCILV